MLYSHFGEIGDLWKHLPLCEILAMEKPEVYVESNSAYSSYSLSHTERQEFGIYTFLAKVKEYSNLEKSVYHQLIRPYVEKDTYIGSAVQAINLTKAQAKAYHFFDIETEALESLRQYGIDNQIEPKIHLHLQDSRVGLYDLLSELPQSSFIHIDPYYIDQPAENGKTYLDSFIKASQRGMKCLLWYGFETLDQKLKLNDYIKSRLKVEKVALTFGGELMMKTIRKDHVVVNPGIVGCGILTSNLSPHIRKILVNQLISLEKMYKGMTYQGVNGELYWEELR